MGEKDAAKSGGQQKKADGGKKDDGLSTVVMKLDLHCEGCATKIKRTVRNITGVKDVKTDFEASKLTVTGKVDPTTLKHKVEEKTHKKVELVSPQPKKDAGPVAAVGIDKKGEGNKSADKKPDDKKPKEPTITTVLLKIWVHCDGCKQKLKRAILKIKGVDSATIDGEKGLATVKGTMDVKELVAYLIEKLKQNVELVAPKKEEGGGGGDKKGKEGGGDKKEKQSGGESKATSSGNEKKSDEQKVEVNKIDYYGYSPYSSYHSAPMHNQGYPEQGYGGPVYDQGYGNSGFGQGYPNQGHVVEHSHPPPPPPPPPQYSNAPQMFSDENPNACSVM